MRAKVASIAVSRHLLGRLARSASHQVRETRAATWDVPTGGRQHAELLPVRQRVTLVHRSFARLTAAPSPPADVSASSAAAPGLRPRRAGTHPPAFTFHPSP